MYYGKRQEFPDTYLIMQIRVNLVTVGHKGKRFIDMLVKEISYKIRGVRVEYMITINVIKSQSDCSDEEVHFVFLLLMSDATPASVRIILTFIAFKYIR